MDVTRTQRLRATALDAAVRYTALSPGRHPATIHAVLADADAFFTWLTKPAPVTHLTLTFGPVADRPNPHYEGATPMANLQLGDSQQVTATVVADDAAGEPVPDQLTWTATPADAVVLTPSADTLSCVIAGAVPTSNVEITATDPAGNTVSGEVDVIGGPAATLTLSFGPVSDKTPPVTGA